MASTPEMATQLPRLPKPKTECGEGPTSVLQMTGSPFQFLRKPMLCAIFKKNLTRFLKINIFR